MLLVMLGIGWSTTTTTFIFPIRLVFHCVPFHLDATEIFKQVFSNRTQTYTSYLIESKRIEIIGDLKWKSFIIILPDQQRSLLTLFIDIYIRIVVVVANAMVRSVQCIFAEHWILGAIRRVKKIVQKR